MARYFFNVIAAADSIVDLEGSELPDLQSARTEGIEQLRELMAEAMRSGVDISSRRLEIREASGTLLATVCFTEPFGRKVEDAVASGKFDRTLEEKAECDDKASQREQKSV